MLFTAFVFKIITKEDKNTGVKKQKYVNKDFSKLRGLKKDIKANEIQEMFAKVETLGKKNYIVSDPTRFEVIYFS